MNPRGVELRPPRERLTTRAGRSRAISHGMLEQDVDNGGIELRVRRLRAAAGGPPRRPAACGRAGRSSWRGRRRRRRRSAPPGGWPHRPVRPDSRCRPSARGRPARSAGSAGGTKTGARICAPISGWRFMTFRSWAVSGPGLRMIRGHPDLPDVVEERGQLQPLELLAGQTHLGADGEGHLGEGPGVIARVLVLRLERVGECLHRGHVGTLQLAREPVGHVAESQRRDVGDSPVGVNCRSSLGRKTASASVDPRTKAPRPWVPHRMGATSATFMLLPTSVSPRVIASPLTSPGWNSYERLVQPKNRNWLPSLTSGTTQKRARRTAPPPRARRSPATRRAGTRRRRGPGASAPISWQAIIDGMGGDRLPKDGVRGRPGLRGQRLGEAEQRARQLGGLARCAS